MKPEIRRERIVDLVRERERVTVDDLSGLLGSSRETIRRDLTDLANRGHVRKFHGGAMLPDGQREGSFPVRLGEAVSEKRAIARAAAALFKQGDTIFIDVGTTTLLFVEELSKCQGLTVITNGPRIAQIMAGKGNEIFVIGGEYKTDPEEMVGALAVEQIGRFHASHAVITVGGLSQSGAMDFRLDETQIARAMIRQADHVTVIADRSKLGRNALFQVCTLEEIDRLVIDAPPPSDLVQSLGAAGVELVLADRSGR
jgi:DeoR family glycerol-3-phosphate regulon repressor